MTQEDRTMLTRINEYAEKVMPDIDPQKTPVSQQLEALRPIMETIASEQGCELQDIFIRYMDLASERSVVMERKFQSTMGNMNSYGDLMS